MNRKMMGAAVGILLLFGSTAFATPHKGPFTDAEILGPDTGVLVFGYKPAEIAYLEFAQMDRSKPAQNIIAEGPYGFIYYFQPLPVNSKYKLLTIIPPDTDERYYYRQKIYDQKGSFTPGLSHSSAFDFTTPTKPGLFYAGTKLDVLEGKNYVNLFGDSADLKYQQISLKYLKKQFAGTRWEPVIDIRIEEVTNELKQKK